MKPGFILNNHNRDENPLFESHDPSMMKDPISGCYYSYSTDTAITSEYQQGIPIRKSKDLINFEYIGRALSEKAIYQARDNGDFPPTEGFWAPFTEYTKNEYRMYYSATKAFGSWESRIWLAVSNSPEGPFENRGVVMDSWNTEPGSPNAIDPHIIEDEKGGKYLVYGSFFGGIYLKELDNETGMSKSSDPKETGKRIAIKPENSRLDGPEGAAVIFNPDTKYYYLFLSYGWLGENYDIRVGRSNSLWGPYLDYKGRDMNGLAHGLKLANSYCFEGDNPYASNQKNKNQSWTYDGFRGPGHGVAFFDEEDGEYYFVHHIRDGAEELKVENPESINPVTYIMHYMMVRKMKFINDWPVFSPEPYAGDDKIVGVGGSLSLKEQQNNESMGKEKIEGNWELIIMDDFDNHVKRSTRIYLSEDSILSFNKKTGKLHFLGESGNLPDVLKDGTGIILPCFDFENSCDSICITGLTPEGVAFWCKKRE